MLSFPLTPQIGDTYTYEAKTWEWTGTVWRGIPATGPQGPEGPQGPKGDPGTAGQAGPAPAGTGIVFVEDGVLIPPTLVLDAGTF
jgi:hypothetical protein